MSYKRVITRREFFKLAGTGAAAISAAAMLQACAPATVAPQAAAPTQAPAAAPTEAPPTQAAPTEAATAAATVASPTEAATAASGLEAAPFPGWVEGLPQIEAPAGFDWKQFAGVTLNFISENTPPSSALSAKISDFSDVTGITVNITQSDLGSVVEKVGLDFGSKSGQYQVIYADPYQLLAPYADKYADLSTFNNDPALPHVPGGIADFIESQTLVTAYFIDPNKLLALPYDCPTMIWMYRKDIIDKYKDQFQQAKGYDWTPSGNLTWDQYYEMADWINSNVPKTEVKYGTGHQAKQYDSLMCDFSNVLAANGGDYFSAPHVGDLGTDNPGKCLLASAEGTQSATFYKKLLSIADPGSTSWDWTGLADAFAAGDVAFAPNWHEFASTLEDPTKSKIAGNIGYSILPKGTKRSANIYGGTGIAINADAPENEQKAAWLFLVWATAPQTELMVLQSPVGGETPVRTSVYNLDVVKKGMQPGTPESKQMPNLLPMPATLEAWQLQNVYMRPKIPQWLQADTVVYTHLSNMLAGTETPDVAMTNAAKEIDGITGA